MRTSYTIKIANTGETFGPNQQDSVRWQAALERGHRITHGVCLCLRDDKPRYVAIRLSSKKKYYLARYGETHHHRMDCRFYVLDASQSGRQGYTLEAVRADEEGGGLVVNLARSLAAPCAAAHDNLNAPMVERHAQPGVKRNRIIPLDSSYEGKLEQALVDARRGFVKPLQYEADDLVFPDFWLTDMGGDYPLEVFGMNTAAYLERKVQKTAIYGDLTKYPRGWWHWDVLNQPEIPTLPAPVTDEPV